MTLLFGVAIDHLPKNASCECLNRNHHTETKEEHHCNAIGQRKIEAIPLV